MKENDLLWIERSNIIVGVILLIGSLYWASWKLTLSILMGFLIVGANFWILKKVVLKAFHQSAQGGAWTQGSGFKLGMALVVKYLLLFMSVGFAIIYFDLHIMGLLVGISTLVISIMGLGIKQIFLS